MADVPRLSHMLRTFLTQDTFDKQKTLHTIYPLVEEKRKQSEREKVERSSLTWNYLKGLTKGIG